MQKDKSPSRIAAWFVLFTAGLAAWILILFYGGDAARAWRALLINFIFATPLASGMVTWSAIVVCSNGRWAGESERLSWTGLGFIVPSLVIMVALWIASPVWVPWYGKPGLAQGRWLNSTFLFLRDTAALIILWISACWYVLKRRQGRRPAWVSGGVLIVIYCVVFTLLSFDLVMALNPNWHSTIFGGYFFISSLYGAVMLWGFLVVLRPQYGPEIRRDFGNLILAFSILTTYFLYIQLLTLWYENMPDETQYLIHRMNYFQWNVISALIVGIIYLGPLVFLLTIWAKENRIYLGAISLLLLIGLWFERWWMVTPTFYRNPVIGWIELAAAAAVLGLLGLSMNAATRFLPALPAEEEKP